MGYTRLVNHDLVPEVFGMVLNLRAVPLAAIFLVAFFAGIPSGPVAEPVAAEDPEELQHFRGWSVGDHWKYRKEATGGNPAQTRGDIVYWVQSAERITNTRFFKEGEYPEEWRSHQVFKVKVWANQTSNSGHGPALAKTEQERYYRTSDLAIAQTHARSSFFFSEAPSNNGGAERYHEYYPPQVELMFPFGIGDKWRAATVMYNENPGPDCDTEGYPPCNTTTKRVHTYTVVGKETLRVTLNGEQQEVETWRIHVLDELGIEDPENLDAKKYHIWWYSPDVCNLVKKEEYSSKRVRTMLWTLNEYSCKGRDAPDPSYSIYDFTNLSSMRRDGKLATPKALAEINALGDSKDGGDNLGGSLVHLAERAPAMGNFVLLAALIGLAMALRRRQD